MLKLGNFLPDLLQNFQKSISPGKFLAVDETLLKFKGRLNFRQYIPSKRARFGIKFFLISDCTTNFIINLIPYQGKNTVISPTLVKEFGYGGAVVLSLMEPFLNTNRVIVIDNWFSSPNLVEELFNRDTGAIGTLRKNRKGVPKMTKKLKVGEVEVYSSNIMMIER